MANRLTVEFVVLGNDNLERNVEKIENKIVNTEKSVNRLGRAGKDMGHELASGLGIPLTPAAALLIGIGALTVGVYKSIDAARAGADANRILGASATEAGLSYDVAAQKSQKWATQTGLSNTQAKESFSSLLRVAQVSGKIGDIDKIQQDFANLAAARGIASKDIVTLTQQIMSGQDEALNRIGLPDPSIIAAAWAKQHQTTMEHMTQQQMVASRVEAVQKAATLATGAAEDRLQSVSGQIIKTEQTLANLMTGVGEAIFTNMEFRDGLQVINDVLGSISISADKVRADLAKGLTPKQIGQQAKADNEAWDFAKGALTLLPAAAAFQKDILSGEGLATANERVWAALNPGQRRADEVEAMAKAEQKSTEVQKKAAAAQDIINAEKTASDARLTAAKVSSNAVLKQMQTEISRDDNLNSQIDGIKRLRVEIEAAGRSGVFAATEVKEKLAATDEQLFQTQKKIQALIVTTFKDTRTFFDDMAERANKDNPFVKFFKESDTVMERMQERFGKFGPAFVAMTVGVENSVLAMEKLALRIASSQKVLDYQAEIRKLQFGPTGTSGEDQRRLSIYGAQINAAVDIPGLEAKSKAILNPGSYQPGALDNGGTLRKQVDGLLSLATQFTGMTGYGDREAQARINAELIKLYEGATPQQQALLAQQGGRGYRQQIGGAYQGQADQKRQDIEDEIRRAQAGRFGVEAATAKLKDLGRFGDIGNDEVRKQFLAVSGALSEGERTPEIIRGRIDALGVEAKKEAEKEKKAEADRKLLNEVLSMMKTQLAGKGFKTTSDTAELLVKIENKASNASVTGPAFSDADAADARKKIQGL